VPPIYILNGIVYKIVRRSQRCLSGEFARPLRLSSSPGLRDGPRPAPPEDDERGGVLTRKNKKGGVAAPPSQCSLDEPQHPSPAAICCVGARRFDPGALTCGRQYIRGRPHACRSALRTHGAVRRCLERFAINRESALVQEPASPPVKAAQPVPSRYRHDLERMRRHLRQRNSTRALGDGSCARDRAANQPARHQLPPYGNEVLFNQAFFSFSPATTSDSIGT
jgi:hypothetical protein